MATLPSLQIFHCEAVSYWTAVDTYSRQFPKPVLLWLILSLRLINSSRIVSGFEPIDPFQIHAIFSNFLSAQYCLLRIVSDDETVLALLDNFSGQ